MTIASRSSSLVGASVDGSLPSPISSRKPSTFAISSSSSSSLPSSSSSLRLVAWLNALPLASSLLVSSLVELRDAVVLFDVWTWLESTWVRGSDSATQERGRTNRPSTAAARIETIVSSVRGYEESGVISLRIPERMRSKYLAMDVTEGSVEAISVLVSFLRDLHESFTSNSKERKRDTSARRYTSPRSETPSTSSWTASSRPSSRKQSRENMLEARPMWSARGEPVVASPRTRASVSPRLSSRLTSSNHGKSQSQEESRSASVQRSRSSTPQHRRSLSSRRSASAPRSASRSYLRQSRTPKRSRNVRSPHPTSVDGENRAEESLKSSLRFRTPSPAAPVSRSSLSRASGLLVPESRLSMSSSSTGLLSSNRRESSRRDRSPGFRSQSPSSNSLTGSSLSIRIASSLRFEGIRDPASLPPARQLFIPELVAEEYGIVCSMADGEEGWTMLSDNRSIRSRQSTSSSIDLSRGASFSSTGKSARTPSRKRRPQTSSPVKNVFFSQPTMSAIANRSRARTPSSSTPTRSSKHSTDNSSPQRKGSRTRSSPRSSFLERKSSFQSSSSSKSQPNEVRDPMIPLTKEEENIVRWALSLGVKSIVTGPGSSKSQKRGALPDATVTQGTVLAACQSGLLLAELANILLNVEIPGISRDTSSRAAARRNIARSLEVFQTDKKIPSTYLWSVEDFADGKPRTCFGFLRELEEVFRSKRMSRSQSATRSSGNFPSNSIDLPREGMSEDKSVHIHGSFEFLNGVDSSHTNGDVSSSSTSKSNMDAHKRLDQIEQMLSSQTSTTTSFSAWTNDPAASAMDSSKVEHSDTGSYIRRDIESKCVSKLIRLGVLVQDLPRSGSVSLLEDPRQNGLLLYDTLCHLGFAVSEIKKKPKTLQEARSNIQACFAVLAKQKSIPTRLLWDPDRVLKGQEAFFWELMFHVLRTHSTDSSSLPLTNSSSNRSARLLQYSTVDFLRLEISLILWLHSLGVCSVEDFEHLRFEDITERMKTGVMLCDIVSIVTGQRIPGIHRSPRVLAACKSNIQAALDILRLKSSMSKRFLWMEDELSAGNRIVCAGLLEDIHRLFDRKPPRSTDPSRAKDTPPEIPYLGEFRLSLMNFSDDQVSQDPSSCLAILLGGKQESTDTIFERSLHRPFTPPTELNALVPVPALREDLHPPIPEPFAAESSLHRTQIGSRRHRRSVSFSDPVDVDEEGLSVNSQSIRSTPFSISALKSTPVGKDAHQSSTSDSVPVPSSPSVRSTSASSSFRPAPVYPGAERVVSAPPVDINGVEVHPTRGYLLTQWLESLGLKCPSPFFLDGASIPDFSNGLLFCQLVEILERTSLRGIHRNPQSRAACLHNIRLGLEQLRLRKNMPLEFLWSEESIYLGDPEVIVNLLDQIRRAYNHHLSLVNKRHESVVRARQKIRKQTRDVSASRRTSRQKAGSS